MDVATFGAGCYWGVEKMFRDAFPLIKHTKVGFMGGKTEKPTYEQVCPFADGKVCQLW
jgi:peptide-methionine (S)-S-oxide reductase